MYIIYVFMGLILSKFINMARFLINNSVLVRDAFIKCTHFYMEQESLGAWWIHIITPFNFRVTIALERRFQIVQRKTSQED